MCSDKPHINILSLDSCVGCRACENICSAHAIQMVEDREGFIYPTVNDDACTSCGTCIKVCPMLIDSSNSVDSGKAFLCTTSESKYYKNSATIGLCTMLAERVIHNGGIVFGCWLDESDWKAYHIEVNSISELEKIRNSKYIQSDTTDSFLSVKHYLKNGREVLYIATPCQIAGLKLYLRRDYDNLYTIDLICHGVYSHKLLNEEIKYWKSKVGGDVYNFKFRSKRRYPWISGGVINFDYKKFGFTRHLECHGRYSPTYFCYAYNGNNQSYNLRPACYSCKFRNSSRYGDLTVGDSWFVDECYKKSFEASASNNGLSLVIANTIKGLSFFKKIESLINVHKIPLEAAFVQPALLPIQREMPKERALIYDSIESGKYSEVINGIFNVDLWVNYLKEKQSYSKKKVKKIIKKLLLWEQLKKIKHYFKELTTGYEWWYINSWLCNFPSIRFRNRKLRKMGMQMTKNVRLYAGFHIRNPKGIVVEDGVSIGPKVLLDGRNGLTIRKNAVIGYEAIIWTMNHDYNDLHFCTNGGPVEIGEYAWVCSRSIILPNIKIGKGAVVASNAVVTKDVPPFAIVAGIPAKVIGYRDEKEYKYGYTAINSKEHFS